MKTKKFLAIMAAAMITCASMATIASAENDATENPVPDTEISAPGELPAVDETPIGQETPDEDAGMVPEDLYGTDGLDETAAAETPAEDTEATPTVDATVVPETKDGKGSPDTGIADVAVIAAGAAILAGGTAIVASRRRK